MPDDHKSIQSAIDAAQAGDVTRITWQVFVTDNQFQGYRNGLNAGGSQVVALSNRVQDFEKEAIIAQKSTSPEKSGQYSSMRMKFHIIPKRE